MTVSTKSDYLYSTETDPDLHDLIQMYVDSMPEKISKLTQLLETSNFDELERKAHDLAGSGGMHGFDTISETAHSLMVAINDKQPKDIIHDLTIQLCDLCSRARAGNPEQA